MVILGIDPGIGRTGYALLEKDDRGKTSLLTYGCIVTPAKKPIPKRIYMLYSDLDRIIKKYKPSVLAIEKLFFSSNAKTAMVVGQAYGAIVLAAEMGSVPVEEVTPLQVKMSLTGYGRADKAQVQKMVMTLLNLTKKPTPDDAADAIAVSLCFASRNLDLVV